MMLSDVCLSVCLMSVAYIGPKSRTERPRKTEIGTEVALVTRDSDTAFRVRMSKVKVIGGRAILWSLFFMTYFGCLSLSIVSTVL